MSNKMGEVLRPIGVDTNPNDDLESLKSHKQTLSALGRVAGMGDKKSIRPAPFDNGRSYPSAVKILPNEDLL